MNNLNQSSDCPAGYNCGFGTDVTRQFVHKNPGGYHSPLATVPEDMYTRQCAAGFYCQRGTQTDVQFRSRCTVGYFCPSQTPQTLLDIKCPSLTTSLSGTASLQGCMVSSIDVCDKVLTLPTNPYEDVNYLNQFSYIPLTANRKAFIQQGLQKTTFDSSSSASAQTGEVEIVQKIQITNESSSEPYWRNETVEAFRACPQYGSGDGLDHDDPSNPVPTKITIVGKNFYDTSLNFCKIRACISANNGLNPRRCKNQVVDQFGNDLPLAGIMSSSAYITRAKYISPTRLECEMPEFLFDPDFYNTLPTTVSGVTGAGMYEGGAAPSGSTVAIPYTCKYLNYLGEVESVQDGSSGNMTYVRMCDPKSVTPCMNKPYLSGHTHTNPGPPSNLEYFHDLNIACTAAEVYAQTCANNPEVSRLNQHIHI